MPITFILTHNLFTVCTHFLFLHFHIALFHYLGLTFTKIHLINQLFTLCLKFSQKFNSKNNSITKWTADRMQQVVGIWIDVVSCARRTLLLNKAAEKIYVHKFSVSRHMLLEQMLRKIAKCCAWNIKINKYCIAIHKFK